MAIGGAIHQTLFSLQGVVTLQSRIGLNGLAPLSLLFKPSSEPPTQNQHSHSSFFSIFIHFPENNDYLIVLLHPGNPQIPTTQKCNENP